MELQSNYTDFYGDPISAAERSLHKRYIETRIDPSCGRAVMELQYENGVVTAMIEVVYSAAEFDAKRNANPDIILRNVYFQAGFCIEDEVSFRNFVQIDRWRSLYVDTDRPICFEDLPAPRDKADYTKTTKNLFIGDTSFHSFEYDADGRCRYIRDDNPHDDIYPGSPGEKRTFDWTGLSYFRFAYPFFPEGPEPVSFPTWQDFANRSR